MIGDHYLWGDIMLKRYGLYALWVNRGHLDIEGNGMVKADVIIYNISEMQNIF